MAAETTAFTVPRNLNPLEEAIYGDLAAAQTPKATPKLEPNVDEAFPERYVAARQATAERKGDFGSGPVGAVLQSGPRKGSFAIEPAAVPRQFLTGNSVEPARVRQYIEAVGGASQAVANMRDALVADLREPAKGIVQPDGQIKSPAFDRWMQRKGRTIDLFPGLRDELGTVRQAQQLLDDATAAHVGAVRDFQNGVARNFLNGDEPVIAIRKAFSSGNPTETFTSLARLVRGNADAEAGLRRGVVDYIMERMSTTTPAGPGSVDFLKADTFRRWIRQNREPLRVLFGGQGAQNLDMVAADLRRQAQRASATTGSDTAQNITAGRKTGLTPVQHGVGITALTLIGEHIGEAIHGGTIGGMAGAVALPVLGHIIHSMRQSGINTINDLVREAMLHPDLARVLMQKASGSELGPIMQRRIATALQSAVLSDMASVSQRKTQ